MESVCIRIRAYSRLISTTYCASVHFSWVLLWFFFVMVIQCRMGIRWWCHVFSSSRQSQNHRKIIYFHIYCSFSSKTVLWLRSLFSLLQNNTRQYSVNMHILAVYCHLCLWGIEEKKNHVHMQTAHELIGERERVKKERGESKRALHFSCTWIVLMTSFVAVVS